MILSSQSKVGTAKTSRMGKKVVFFLAFSILGFVLAIPVLMSHASTHVGHKSQGRSGDYWPADPSGPVRVPRRLTPAINDHDRLRVEEWTEPRQIHDRYSP